MQAAGISVEPGGIHDAAPPAYTDKCRTLFDEIVTSRAQAVDFNAFLGAMRRLNLGLSTEQVSELFQRADQNGDGVVDWHEWLRWCEIHPTLVDCLFFRSRDAWEDARRRDGIEAAQQAAAELRVREADARESVTQAQSAVAQAEARGSDEEHRLNSARSQLDAAQDALQSARSATEASRGRLRQGLGDLEAAEEGEGRCRDRCSTAMRNTEAAAQQVAAQSAVARAAQDRLDELQRQLEQQRQELVRAEQHAQRAREEHRAAQGAEDEERARAAAAAAEVGAAAAQLKRFEDQVELALQGEEDATAALQRAARDIEAAAAASAQAQQQLAAVKAEEAAQRASAAAAAQALDAQEGTVAALELRREELCAQRRCLDAEELPLIEQEVRLRARRETLEQDERRLASAVQGRAVLRSPDGSPFRSPPPRSSAPAARSGHRSPPGSQLQQRR
eukprot:TRINITY_DN11559_c0_g1_i2.p2 TRINITY_DN11559_c0_g1~~TRINITY_DN11559_c0_g1_i2.p2  ORF type:complete len:449 (+),score=171.10 TRINITY_DN11559_c0_g1_i2:90-1436(+)